jgi:hypothetical protein
MKLARHIALWILLKHVLIKSVLGIRLQYLRP